MKIKLRKKISNYYIYKYNNVDKLWSVYDKRLNTHTNIINTIDVIFYILHNISLREKGSKQNFYAKLYRKLKGKYHIKIRLNEIKINKSKL